MPWLQAETEMKQHAAVHDKFWNLSEAANIEKVAALSTSHSCVTVLFADIVVSANAGNRSKTAQYACSP